MDLKLRNNSQLALSSGFIPVEYIEFSGTPNINTGYTMNLNVNVNTIVEAIIEITGNEQANSPIYIVGTGSGTNSPRFKLICNEDSYTSFKVSSKTIDSVGNQVVEFSGKTNIIQQVRKITINGNDTTLNSGTAFATQSILYLLTGKAQGKIWSLKVKTSETNVVRDYIPAISYQEGHFGEACLYDKVNRVFYYSASTGSFTASTSVYAKMITAYIKDCPNISGIDLLRRAVNLQRIRCDVGNVSGTVAELLRYTALAGFTDDYQEQQIPRIIGTWTLNNWYTNEELENFQGAIDGLTVLGDGTHNIDTALENGDFAIQTLDSTKPNYNPAVAIRLNANGYGNVTSIPLINNGGRFLITKNDVAAIAPLPLALFRQVKTVTDDNSIVTDDNTIEYSFTTFNEFQYFTGISTITGDSGTLGGAFCACNLLTSIILPNTITTIGASAFYGCSSILSIIIPNSVTTFSTHSLANMSGITNLTFPVNSTCYNNTIDGSGNVTGTLKVGTIRGTSNSVTCRYKNVYIYTKATGENNHQCLFGSAIYTVHLNGDFKSTSNHNGNVLCANSATNVRFVEIMGKYIGTYGGVFQATTGLYNGCIMHLGSNEIAGSTTLMRASFTRLSKIYVGDGSSRAADAAVFALYNADTNWSTYCGNGVPGDGKVDLWWNYNGEYKWYYITDNLTNCTNSNPDAWPHITRGNTYSTGIVADEGMTIDSITVEMLDTDTTSSTYDTMVDITSSVYDSSTGEISIPSVTGNVIITASAS